MKTLLCIFISGLLGIGLGKLIFQTNERTPDLPETTSPSTKSNRPTLTTYYDLSRIVDDQALDLESTDITNIIKETRINPLSPLRGESLLSLSIDNTTAEELHDLLSNGKIEDYNLLSLAGTKLAEHNPERTADHMLYYKYKLKSTPGMQAYDKAVIAEVIKKNPNLLLKELHKLPRGGNQRHYAIKLSNALVVSHPKFAITHMEELVNLRDLRHDNPLEEYANSFVKNLSTDQVPSMIEFTNSLPSGDKKNTLLKLLESKHSNSLK